MRRRRRLRVRNTTNCRIIPTTTKKIEYQMTLEVYHDILDHSLQTKKLMIRVKIELLLIITIDLDAAESPFESIEQKEHQLIISE